ncbi:Nucleotide exchange factor GrpE [Vibrio crassostreae]|uniref:hypothetical protein n=1 Tax=Vibrio crassostreae TaxID=246167 RepID=UPI00105347F3|nr:hypothetical protein [Vibrio crassostreae]TCT63793.1 hypothetical protein EDB40_101285 [Vibrio crassostreae]CAK2020290.1 Nucleotide exchange factor GrpE [Vibrio crassostreae]CAK2069648.1 Nucleotide exchange factor GrpE [Vibrio crassostreae]CAK2092367.1 Nucleotide exchange factor GrpE [Vibrio crassostreae]CAK2150033.1 Nucleotide exchange factor GrpE [Vibrio crassostreae]
MDISEIDRLRKIERKYLVLKDKYKNRVIEVNEYKDDISEATESLLESIEKIEKLMDENDTLKNVVTAYEVRDSMNVDLQHLSEKEMKSFIADLVYIFNTNELNVKNDTGVIGENIIDILIQDIHHKYKIDVDKKHIH